MHHAPPHTSIARRFFPLLLVLMLGLSACSTQRVDRQVLYLSCSTGQRLVAYTIEPKTGALSELQSVELEGRGGPIALTDDGQALYAVIGNPPRLVPMTRDISTGKLTALEPTPLPDTPTYLDIDATGRFALTAAYGAGTVHSFRLNPDRTVVAAPVQTTKTDKNAHACLIDPSNRFVYIPHTGPNAIFQFGFDASEGKLKTTVQPIIVKGGGTADQPQGPRHYAYHPRLDVVYFVNELDSSVAAYTWDRTAGNLQRFQSMSTLPGRWDGKNTCADIHVTPDGRFLYASNRGHDSIAAYRLDSDGNMTMIDTFPTEAVPREFAIDLNGEYLYAAGLRTNKLVAYAIDRNTGKLTRTATYDTPEGPIWVEAVKVE